MQPAILPPEVAPAPSELDVLFESLLEPLRKEVLLPLFSFDTAEELEARAPEILQTGALIRYRWYSDMTDEQRAEVHSLCLSLSQNVHKEIVARVAAILGDERSFALERALHLTVVDGPSLNKFLLHISEDDLTDSRLLCLARLVEPAATYELYLIGWLLVLSGDIPLPTIEVLQDLASQFLAATTQYQDAARDATGTLPSFPLPPIEVEALGDFFEKHRKLWAPFSTLVGFALDQAAPVHVYLTDDPEIPGYSTVMLSIASEEGYALVMERALRSGVLAVMDDDFGSLCICADPA